MLSRRQAARSVAQHIESNQQNSWRHISGRLFFSGKSKMHLFALRPISSHPTKRMGMRFLCMPRSRPIAIGWVRLLASWKDTGRPNFRLRGKRPACSNVAHPSPIQAPERRISIADARRGGQCGHVPPASDPFRSQHFGWPVTFFFYSI